MKFDHLYITKGRIGTNHDPGNPLDFDLDVARVNDGDGCAWIYELPQSKEARQQFKIWVACVFGDEAEVTTSSDWR